MIAAVVLAAGKSERMGRPKALLPLGNEVFLERILRTIADAGLGHTVVVLGHHRDAIAARVALPAAVENPRYAEGMTTSVQAGILGLPAGAAAAMIFLVDQPLVGTRTVTRLAQAAGPGRIVLPVREGRRGHPVLFARELWGEILALGPDAGLNRVVRADPLRVREVPVDDPGILIDVDTPDEYARLGRGGGPPG